MIELKGMTWDHDRAFGPLLATSRAFRAARPDVDVSWEIRSLEDFAHYPIDRLADAYDIIAVDHPFMGRASALECLLPLDDLLDPETLAGQAAESVGGSHASYRYGGHQWAFAVDAACHVAAGRPDLLPVDEWPSTWEDVVLLSGSADTEDVPRVALPLVPTDLFCLFMTVLASRGSPAFQSPDRFAERPSASEAFETIHHIVRTGHPHAWGDNAIDILERMSTTDEVAYVPAVFGYTNYARAGYRPHRVLFRPIPSEVGGVLGGVGLALSASSHAADAAAAYVRFVADAEVQRSIVALAGGQPASATAWSDPAADLVAGGFLSSTRLGIESAWMRPRFDGMTDITPTIGRLLRDALHGDRSIESTLDECDAIYRASLDGRDIREPDEVTSGWAG